VVVGAAVTVVVGASVVGGTVVAAVVGGGTVVATAPGLEAVKVTYPFYLPNGRKARFWHAVIIEN
jgi:hypothetical protein